MIHLQVWGRNAFYVGVNVLIVGVALLGLSSCGENEPVDVSKSALSKPGNARNQAALEAFDRWTQVLTSGAIDEARALCESWLEEPDRGHHAEAHKCMANVTIATSRVDIGGLPPAAEGAVRSPISSDGIDGGLSHYESALVINPLDFDAHIGRVDILIIGGRYRDANTKLDESLTTFGTRELLDDWFKLLGRFQRANAATEALTYLKVIEKHHPLDHRLVSNMGAYLAITGDHEEAFAYSTRAMAINPDDPINKWNLAKIHDQRDELEDADRLYQDALATIEKDDVRARCEYAGFLALRMEDATRACTFAETGCPELFKANCIADDPETAEANAGGSPSS